MELNTEEDDFIPMADQKGDGLLVCTREGDYIFIPSTTAFLKDTMGEALLIDGDSFIYVLRKGIKKNSFAWVKLNEEYDEE